MSMLSSSSSALLQFGDALLRMPEARFNCGEREPERPRRPLTANTANSRTPPLVAAKKKAPSPGLSSYPLHPSFATASRGVKESASLAKLMHRPFSANTLVRDVFLLDDEAGVPGDAAQLGDEDDDDVELADDELQISAAESGPVDAAGDASQQPSAGVRRLSSAARTESPAPATAYGWQTVIAADKGRPVEVMLSAGALPQAPRDAKDLVAVHGRAHFFLQTGVWPDSLMPKPTPPPQVRLGSQALAKRKERLRAERAAVEKERLQIEATLARVRRETTPLARAARDVGSAEAPSAWPGSRLADAADDRAYRNVEEPPPGPMAFERLGSTVAYMRSRGFDHQQALDGRLRQRRHTPTTRASTTPASAPPASASAPTVPDAGPMGYLYPSGHAHLAGSGFVAMRAVATVEAGGGDPW
jgi:hypothetical protein